MFKLNLRQGSLRRGAGAAPTIAVLNLNPTSVSDFEGNTGTNTRTFTINRSGLMSSTCSVPWQVQPKAGSANPVSASDFAGGVFPSGTASFVGGESAKTVNVEIAGDTTVEGNEEYELVLGVPTDAVVGAGVAYGTILNDDTAPPADTTPPTITSQNAYSVDENQTLAGQATASEANCTWTVGGSAASQVTLNTVTGAWTLAPQDYESTPSVSFTLIATDPAGNASLAQTVTVTINDVAEGGGGPTAPVMTRTSTQGQNPMSWDTYFPALSVNVDTIKRRWRVNGGAWTNEADIPVTSTWYYSYMYEGQNAPWTLYDAATFAINDFIEVQTGVERPGFPIAWSLVLSDTMADTQPDAFSFTDQTGVTSGATITSNQVTITGINGTALVSTSLGEVSINGGSWVTSGTITNGQTLRARHTASTQGGATVDQVVTVGGVSDTFSSTTVGSSVQLQSGQQFDFANYNYGNAVDSRTITNAPAGTLFVVTDIGDGRTTSGVTANGNAMTKRWESGGRALWSWDNPSQQNVTINCTFSAPIGWHAPAWLVLTNANPVPASALFTDNGWTNGGDTRTHPAITIPADGRAVAKLYTGGLASSLAGATLGGVNPAGDQRIIHTAVDGATPAVTTVNGSYVNWLTFVFQKV